MAEYRITGVKKGDQWESSYGTFQSYALALDGLGEPVQLNKKVPVRQEPSIGDVLTGSVEEKTSKAGRPYYRFKAENNFQQKSNGNKYDSDGMAWGNSLTNAVSIVSQLSKTGDDDLSLARKALEVAHLFFSERPGARDLLIGAPAVQSETQLPVTTGTTAPKKPDVVIDDIPEQEINLDDIPF